MFRIHQEIIRKARVAFAIHGFSFEQGRESQTDVVQFNFHGVVPKSDEVCGERIVGHVVEIVNRVNIERWARVGFGGDGRLTVSAGDQRFEFLPAAGDWTF